MLQAGIHDIPADQYHADPCGVPSLSAGLAQTMITATPLHAWTASARLNPDFEADDKTAFDIGRAVHEVLTGKGGGIADLPFDDYRTKAAQQARDEAREAGLTPLTIKQSAMVKRMEQTARAQIASHGLADVFSAAQSEITLIWEQDGAMNRAMVDFLCPARRIAIDYKTCAGLAEPDAWVRTAMGHGIDLRAAHYLDGLRACYGGDWTYLYMPQEKEPPHCLSVLSLSSSAIVIGQKKIRRAREMWSHCLRTGHWPAWSAEIAVIEPPPFYESRWLERESYEADHKRRHGADILETAMRWQAPHITNGATQ